jgi:hypothetical protein
MARWWSTVASGKVQPDQHHCTSTTDPWYNTCTEHASTGWIEWLAPTELTVSCAADAAAMAGAANPMVAAVKAVAADRAIVNLFISLPFVTNGTKHRVVLVTAWVS